MDFGTHSVFPLQFVAATQPINALAFVFDGVNFGASDFAYSAYSMVSSLGIPFLYLSIDNTSQTYLSFSPSPQNTKASKFLKTPSLPSPQNRKFQQILNSENAFYVQVTVALFSILFLFILSSSYKFVGIWVALTIYMSLRALAGFWRYMYMINF